MTYTVEAVNELRNALGEGPLWVPPEGALYWVDIADPAIFRYQPDSGLCESMKCDTPITALGMRSGGGLIAATADGFAFLDFRGRQLKTILKLEAKNTKTRFNDGAVDPLGRFWAGTMDEERTPTNHLYRLDADLSAHCLESGIIVANGLGWSPDHRTMYFTDTRKRRIYAYDFDPSSGDIANRRVLIETPDEPAEGTPDGLTVDSEGFIWSVRFRGGKICRYDPGGKLERQIDLPVKHTTSCMFGGEDLDTLFITSAAAPLTIAERHVQPLAGSLLQLQPGVRGLPEFIFGA